MPKKLLILLFLLTFPSVLYVFLSTGETHFIRLPYFGNKELSVDGKDTIYHSIPAFSLVNQDGDTITEKYYDSTIYVADYFFTTCKTICPKMTTELLRVQEKFAYTKGMVKILSHTVDPEHDSVPELKAYSEMVHADTKVWNFVTGDKKHLYELARKGYLLNALEGDGGPNDFIHSELLVLVDKEKHIRGIYDGTNIKEVNELLDDIRVLIAEYFIMEQPDDKSQEITVSYE